MTRTMLRHLLITAAAAGLCAGPVAAHPGAGPPAGVPAMGHPPTMPVQNPVQHPVQPPARNPNGAPPIGKPANPGNDTDRGHSEHIVGTVASFKGNTLTLTLPNGRVKTFTVNQHALGQLRPQQGQHLAIDSDDTMRAMTVVDADQTIRGRVTKVTKDSVVLMLPNGKSHTISVSSRAVAQMNLKPGTNVRVISHDGGETATTIDIDHQ